MRCKCCNSEIFPNQLKFDKVKKTFEDLCHVCRGASRSKYTYTNDHAYEHGDVKEGTTQPLKVPE